MISVASLLLQLVCALLTYCY